MRSTKMSDDQNKPSYFVGLTCIFKCRLHSASQYLSMNLAVTTAQLVGNHSHLFNCI